MPRMLRHGSIFVLLFFLTAALAFGCREDGEPGPTDPTGPVEGIPDNRPAQPPADLPPEDPFQIEGETDAACDQPVSWAFAQDHIGERVAIVGPIEEVTEHEEGLQLRFGAPQGEQETPLSIVIPENVLDRYPSDPGERYDGQTVCVFGVIQEVDQELQIFVSAPGQIAPVDGDGEENEEDEEDEQ